jgi:hypothetical protein
VHHFTFEQFMAQIEALSADIPEVFAIPVASPETVGV